MNRATVVHRLLVGVCLATAVWLLMDTEDAPENAATLGASPMHDTRSASFSAWVDRPDAEPDDRFTAQRDAPIPVDAAAGRMLPSGDLQVPQPVTLDRAGRRANPSPLEPDAAPLEGNSLQDQASGRISYDSPTGQTGQAQLGGAWVSERDLGLRFYPGARSSATDSVRIDDPSGQTLSTQFTVQDTADNVARFYRAQLGTGGEQVEESRVSSQQILLRTTGDRPGPSRSVLILQQAGGVSVLLTQWKAPQR